MPDNLISETGKKNLERVGSMVENMARKYGVDPNLAKSVFLAETGNVYENPETAVSPAGAIGAMQLSPQTAQSLGVNPNDLQQNIEGGIKYLKEQLDRFGGDVSLAVSAYNAGPTRVSQTKQQYGGGWVDMLPAETRKYLNNIGGYYEQLSRADSSTSVDQIFQMWLGKSDRHPSSAFRPISQMPPGTKIKAFREIVPNFNDMSDESLISYLHQTYHPEMDYRTYKEMFLDEYGDKIDRGVLETFGVSIIASTVQNVAQTVASWIEWATGKDIFFDPYFHKPTVNLPIIGEVNVEPEKRIANLMQTNPWAIITPFSRDGAKWWATVFGSSLPYAAITLGTGTVAGGLIGVGAEAAGATAAMTKLSATVGGTLVGAAMDSFVEAGNVRAEAIANGATVEEANQKANEVFSKNVPLDLLVNGIQIGNIFKGLNLSGKVIAKETVKDGFFKRLGKNMVIEALPEGAQEGMQRRIENIALGRDPNEGVFEEAIGGLGMGIVFGVGASIFDAAGNVSSNQINEDINQISQTKLLPPHKQLFQDDEFMRVYEAIPAQSKEKNQWLTDMVRRGMTDEEIKEWFVKGYADISKEVEEAAKKARQQPSTEQLPAYQPYPLEQDEEFVSVYNSIPVDNDTKQSWLNIMASNGWNEFQTKEWFIKRYQEGVKAGEYVVDNLKKFNEILQTPPTMMLDKNDIKSILEEAGRISPEEAAQIQRPDITTEQQEVLQYVPSKYTKDVIGNVNNLISGGKSIEEISSTLSIPTEDISKISQYIYLDKLNTIDRVVDAGAADAFIGILADANGISKDEFFNKYVSNVKIDEFPSDMPVPPSGIMNKILSTDGGEYKIYGAYNDAESSRIASVFGNLSKVIDKKVIDRIESTNKFTGRSAEIFNNIKEIVNKNGSIDRNELQNIIRNYSKSVIPVIYTTKGDTPYVEINLKVKPKGLFSEQAGGINSIIAKSWIEQDKAGNKMLIINNIENHSGVKNDEAVDLAVSYILRYAAENNISGIAFADKNANLRVSEPSRSFSSVVYRIDDKGNYSLYGYTKEKNLIPIGKISKEELLQSGVPNDIVVDILGNKGRKKLIANNEYKKIDKEFSIGNREVKGNLINDEIYAKLNDILSKYKISPVKVSTKDGNVISSVITINELIKRGMLRGDKLLFQEQDRFIRGISDTRNIARQEMYLFTGMLRDGKTMAADVSTLIEEFFHLYTETGLSDAQKNLIRQWKGKDIDEFTNAEKEELAREFHKYLTTQQAPNEVSRKFFSRIKRWLLNTYEYIKKAFPEFSDKIDSRLSKLFDSLLDADAKNRLEIEYANDIKSDPNAYARNVLRGNEPLSDKKLIGSIRDVSSGEVASIVSSLNSELGYKAEVVSTGDTFEIIYYADSDSLSKRKRELIHRGITLRKKELAGNPLTIVETRTYMTAFGYDNKVIDATISSAYNEQRNRALGEQFVSEVEQSKTTTRKSQVSPGEMYKEVDRKLADMPIDEQVAYVLGNEPQSIDYTEVPETIDFPNYFDIELMNNDIQEYYKLASSDPNSVDAIQVKNFIIDSIKGNKSATKAYQRTIKGLLNENETILRSTSNPQIIENVKRGIEGLNALSKEIESISTGAESKSSVYDKIFDKQMKTLPDNQKAKVIKYKELSSKITEMATHAKIAYETNDPDVRQEARNNFNQLWDLVHSDENLPYYEYLESYGEYRKLLRKMDTPLEQEMRERKYEEYHIPYEQGERMSDAELLARDTDKLYYQYGVIYNEREKNEVLKTGKRWYDKYISDKYKPIINAMEDKEEVLKNICMHLGMQESLAKINPSWFGRVFNLTHQGTLIRNRYISEVDDMVKPIKKMDKKKQMDVANLLVEGTMYRGYQSTMKPVRRPRNPQESIDWVPEKVLNMMGDNEAAQRIRVKQAQQMKEYNQKMGEYNKWLHEKRKEYNSIGKVFTMEELKSRGYSDDVINAYFTMRKAYDKMTNNLKQSYYINDVANGAATPDEIEDMFRLVGYIPLGRGNGKFVLKYKDDTSPKGYGWMRYKSRFEAEQVRKELIEKGLIDPSDPTQEVSTIDDLKHRLHELPYYELMNLIDRAEVTVDENVSKLIKASLATSYTSSRRIPRGYVGVIPSLDWFWDQFDTYNATSANRFAKALVKSEVNWLASSIESPRWKRFAMDFVDNTLSPKEMHNTKFWDRTRQLGFMYALSLNLSNSLINLTQPITQTIPYLYWKIFNTNMTDVIKSMELGSKYGLPVTFQTDVKSMAKLKELEDRYPYILQMMEECRKKGALDAALTEEQFTSRNLSENIHHYAGILQSKSERQNRSSTIIASYTLAYDKIIDNAKDNPELAKYLSQLIGLTDEELIRIAKDPSDIRGPEYQLYEDIWMRKLLKGGLSAKDKHIVATAFAIDASSFTQGIFARHNLPAFIRKAGPFAEPLRSAFLFKGFINQYIGFLAATIKANGMLSPQTIVALAPMLMLGGLHGFPFSDDIMEALRQLGIFNTEKAIREIVDNGSISTLILHGLPALLPQDFAFDISSRIGPGQVLPKGLLYGDVESALSDIFLGAPYGFISQSVDGIKEINAGNTSVGLRKIMPVFIANLIKATQYSEEGAATTYGNLLVPPEELSTTQLLGTAIGFKPASVAIEEEKIRVMKYSTAQYRAMVQKYNERLAMAIFEEDYDSVADYTEDLMQWNADVEPQYRYNISKEMPSIRRRVTMLKNKDADLRFMPAQFRAERAKLEALYE
jgi:disulfide oxidoreductase YuzD